MKHSPGKHLQERECKVYNRLQNATSVMQSDSNKEHESILKTRHQSKKLLAEQKMLK